MKLVNKVLQIWKNYGNSKVLPSVKSTSPDTENHDKNGYAKLYDDKNKNIFMTNVDKNYSDMTYTNKHKNTEYKMRNIDE